MNELLRIVGRLEELQEKAEDPVVKELAKLMEEALCEVRMQLDTLRPDDDW